MGILQAIFDFFQVMGPYPALVALFIIVFLDAIVFPVGPEMIAIIIFSFNPTVPWAVAILLVVAVAQVGGTSVLYWLGKNLSSPKKLTGFTGRIKKIMQNYQKFLFIKDERIVLVNCFVPILPFLGAFMAVSKWSYKKCMAFVVLGGTIKYTIFLSMSVAFYEIFKSGLAWKVSIVMVFIVLCISGAYAFVKRKKLLEK
jgi:membrane protein YqaA with SNARE-associated domain